MSESGFLDHGRKRPASERLQFEFGLERETALRLLGSVGGVGGRLDRARWLVETRSRGALLSLVDAPMSGPLLGYDPRSTGSIPDGLTPFTPFVHARVAVTPELARELSGRVLHRDRSVSWSRVDHLASEMVDPHPQRRWSYSPDHRVVLDQRGFVVDGSHLLFAVVAADRVIELDFWHNFPGDEWARIEKGRRRPPPDALTFKRPGPRRG